MSIKINKESDLKRLEKENKNKQKIQWQQKIALEKHKEQEIESELMGAFKRICTDVFIKNYTKNYGETFDFQSINNAFKFHNRRINNDLRPEFSFDTSMVKFESDFNKENRQFNFNANKEFFSNQDLIDGGLLKEKNFNMPEERVAYYEQESLNFQSSDIFISNKERYSEFNKINKLLGFSSQEETKQQSLREASFQWNNRRNKIISDITQRVDKKFRQEEIK